MDKQIDNVEIYFNKLIGLPVSLPWTGYGSAIFLELGNLQQIEHPRQYHQHGEACIDISQDWRCEKDVKVLFGSSNSNVEIDDGIKNLRNAVVKDLHIYNNINDIEIVFDNGFKITTMIMLNEDPDWSIRFNKKEYLYSKNGSFYIGEGISKLTDEEKTAFALAEKTATRWGTPLKEPIKGNCSTCKYFIRIDGNADLLDYGVCILEESVFDGKVVNRESGCPEFTIKN